MNLSYKIARRYLISKKSTNAVNIISLITAIAIALGTMALILVLSVFNGFEGLVLSLYDTYNAEIEISPKSGKTFELNEQQISDINSIDGVSHLSTIIEENAIIVYDNKQHIATLKGVDEHYFNVHPTFKDKILEQKDSPEVTQPILNDGELDYALIGIGISQNLGINTTNPFQKLHIHIPRRNSSVTSFESATNRASIIPVGTFAIQQEFNAKYIIVPKLFLANLLDYENEISAAEIKIAADNPPKVIINQIKNILGADYLVKDRLQQNEALYKVMKTEKWVVFIILTFIIIIASFNIIGSLSMLIIEKKPDVATLMTLGATKKMITRIFLTESMLLSCIGAFTGMFIALILCLLQQHVGLIKIPGNTFLVKFYPVKMMAIDFIAVSAAVILISFITSYLPAKRAATNINLIEQMRRG